MTGTGLDTIVSSGATSILREIVGFVVEGAAWLLHEVAGLIGRTTSPDVTASWFQPAYADMTLIAGLALLPFLLVAIVQHLIRRDVGGLVRAVLVHLPLAVLGTAAAVVVVDLLVELTDDLSAWVGRSVGPDLTEFATSLGTAVVGLTAPAGGGVAGFASLLVGAAIAFAAFVIWLELLLRQAAIYIAVLFLPLAFAATVWPATAHWLRRLVEGLVAIILSKFVIVAVIALAASAMDAQVATDGFGVVIAGASMLTLAALAPYVLLRLIPVFESGLTSQLEGTYRRPTAAVGSPARGGQVVHMARQRLGASWLASRGAGAATAGSTMAAGAGAVTAGGTAVASAGAKTARHATRTAGETSTEVATPRGGQPDTSRPRPNTPLPPHGDRHGT